MFTVELGNYMQPLHFKTLQEAQDFCSKILKWERFILNITEEKESD